MNILRIFGLWNREILAKGFHTAGTVTAVRTSFLHVVKKPVRIGLNPGNTIFSHFITFEYFVDGTLRNGILYVDIAYRCPQTGEKIDVYYDPKNPQYYACYPFGPNTDPIGW